MAHSSNGDTANPTRIRFLVWKDGRENIQDSIEDLGQIFSPPALNCNLSNALALPTGVAPCGDPNEMLREMATTISDHVDLLDQAYFLLATNALCTWFPDCVEVVPYHVICGPTGSGKTTLLKLIRCFCRRAILAGDVSPASLYRITDLVNPTLLLDECEFNDTRRSRDLQRFLRAGNTEGEYVARGNALFDGYCAKIICVNQPIEDVALNTRCIHTFTLPSNRQLKPIDKCTLNSIAAEWQRKLLMFRLANLDRLSRSPLLMDEMERYSPKMRNIARALKAPLLGDQQLKSQLMEALQEQDEDAVLERGHEPIWYVVATLFSCSHLPRAGELTVGMLAAEVNKLRISFGEERLLTARKVGALLKMVGVKTKQLGNWGRGFEFTANLGRKIHALARSFGITRRDITNWMAVKSGCCGPPCSLCTKLELNAGLSYYSPPPSRRKRAPLFSAKDESEAGGKSDPEANSPEPQLKVDTGS